VTQPPPVPALLPLLQLLPELAPLLPLGLPPPPAKPGLIVALL
jgi:hypothetical protein